MHALFTVTYIIYILIYIRLHNTWTHKIKCMGSIYNVLFQCIMYLGVSIYSTLNENVCICNLLLSSFFYAPDYGFTFHLSYI